METFKGLTDPSYSEPTKENEIGFAAIFDMDGTLIDNTPYHYKSWCALFKKYGKGDLSQETYYNEISGVPVFNSIRRIFGNEYDESGLKRMFKEKEEFYRAGYGLYVKPIEGLEVFLKELKDAGVKMAMATSATDEDIDFILDRIPIKKYFDAIVNSAMVNLPKPDPQIFLKAAEKLNIIPANCVVFEDSIAGIKAANTAGMKVVGITTGHKPEELQPADLTIDNYTGLSAHILAALFKK